MKKTTFYTLISISLLIGLTVLTLLIQWLRASITYAHESQLHTNAIQSTESQIKQNSTRRNEIDQQIRDLKQEQHQLELTNKELRPLLSQQKTQYQEFLGFDSGK